MIRVVIIEDEILTAQRLEKLLLSLDPTISVLAQLSTVRQSIEWLQTHAFPDLMFVDIQLSDGISFEIFEEVSLTIPVIFTTAYDQYALDAFQVNGIGYLLKPVEKEKLKNCLDRYQQYAIGQEPARLLRAIEKIEAGRSEYRKRFLVSYREQLLPVAVQDIAYFCSEYKNTYIISFDNQKFLIDFTLEELEQQLDPSEFMRISRQLIVSPRSIKKIHQHFNGRLKLDLMPPSKEETIISRERSAQFRSWLDR